MKKYYYVKQGDLKIWLSGNVEEPKWIEQFELIETNWFKFYLSKWFNVWL